MALGNRLALLKAPRAPIARPSRDGGAGGSATGGMKERLAALKEEAELRGPVESEYPEDALDDFRPERPTTIKPPALAASDVFPDSPSERARVAMGNAGLDCETKLHQPGLAVPKLIVTGYQAVDGRQMIVTGADITDVSTGMTVSALDDDGNLDPAIHAKSFLAFTDKIVRDFMKRRDSTALVPSLGAAKSTVTFSNTGLLVNQNIAYDFCAIADSAHRADVALGLVGKVEGWFDQVMHRIFEMLDLHLIEDVMLRERLLDLAEGTLGKDHESLTEKGNARRKGYALKPMVMKYLGVDMDKFTFRLGYARYENLVLKHYDAGAVEYLTDDVEGALQVCAQQQRRAEMNGLPVGARIPNSAEQSKAAFSLNLVRAWGMRTSLSKVQQLDADLDSTARRLLGVLKETGLVRSTGRQAGTKDMKRVWALVQEMYEEKKLVVPKTPTGRISTAGSVLEDIALIKLRGSSDDVLDEHGRIDETELFKQPLYALSQWTSVQKVQNTYLPVLYTGVDFPINTSFETILETGRISSFKPNLNNMPRGGSKTLLQRLQKRVRECFVPRQGFVYCSVDYSMLELVTLSQCLLWFFGGSKMADAINAGFDLHTLFVAEQLLNIDYKEAVRRIKYKSGTSPVPAGSSDAIETALHKEAADMRQLAKVCNFGLGGGMGAASLTEFAAATYNVHITEDEARALKEKWLNQWPEMRAYFKLIGSMMRGYDEYGQTIGDMEQFVSGRIRGRTRYCAMANGFFQALAADGAKSALYALQKACYLIGGPLYGSRVVAFFYDEFFMEHPEETAHERAFIQRDIAVSEMKAVVPDVKVGAEPALQRCWMKEAEPTFDSNKRLIPYEPPAMLAA